MKFKLLVTSKESGDIEIPENYVRSVEYFYDTVDNSSLDKSSKINVRVKITGELSNDCKDSTMNLAKWALLTRGADVYRELKVEVTDEAANFIREYILSECFVLDYKEFCRFDNQENTYSDKLVWELLVSQKGDRLEDVKVKA